MTTLEDFYFGNINPSEYRQSGDTKKKLSEIAKLLDGLLSMLTTEHQKDKLEQIENCQLSLIATKEESDDQSQRSSVIKNHFDRSEFSILC